jgi:gluconolactonase
MGEFWLSGLMMKSTSPSSSSAGALSLGVRNDCDPVQRAIYDGHFYAGMTPEVMAATKGSIAPWMASLTFGGPDLRTVYLGSLMGTTIPYFRAPVAGLPLAHWNRQ